MIRNKYPGRCFGCRVSVSAQAGWLLGKSDGGYWQIQCDTCYFGEAQAERQVELPCAEPPPRQASSFDESDLHADWIHSMLWNMLASRRQQSIVKPLRVLGLTPPVTAEKLKIAYRLSALKTHPDRGGSAEAFIAVQSAYEAALKVVGREVAV